MYSTVRLKPSVVIKIVIRGRKSSIGECIRGKWPWGVETSPEKEAWEKTGARFGPFHSVPAEIALQKGKKGEY